MNILEHIEYIHIEHMKQLAKTREQILTNKNHLQTLFY